MADNNTVVLRVQLDEGKTEAQLKQLVLDIEKTRAAQLALNASRKAGQVTDEQFAQQTVELRQQLKAQQQEQTALTKNLDLYRTATGELANSYAGQQAQLSLAQRQYQQLQGSQTNSTESTKALAATIAELRGELTETDKVQGLFVRSVGNYPKGESLESLVRQMVKLQEETKNLAAGTDQAAAAQVRIIGFQTQVAQAGAKEGKTFEETTNFVKEYSEAIRPATADLVKLTQQQQEAAESGEATAEAMQAIGFKIGAARKNIEDATKALAKVPDEAAEGAKEVAKAGEETKGFGAQLLEAASGSDKLGETIEVLTGAKEKYTVATNLAKAAIGAEATVLGVLRAALLATGLGALVVVLGLIVTGLLKSQAATDFLSRKMAALGGAIQPLLNLGAELGDVLIAAAENPKQAFSDFVDFLGQNLLNRLKGVANLVKDITNGNFGKLGDDLIQFGTGIEGATGKLQALGAEMQAAAQSAEQIAAENQRIRESERALNVERDQSRAKIEALKKLADDTTKSIPARTAAAKQAAAIENGLLAQQEKLQDRKIANLQAEQALKKSLSTEDKDALAELQRERAQSTQESLTLQTELQNTLNGLVQEGLDKSITARQQYLAVEASLLDKQLAQVKQNSDEELSLQQQKLRNAYQAEVNVKNLTIAQKKKAELDYEAATLALSQDFAKRRATAAYEAEAASVQAQLALVAQGSQQETELQVEAIRSQLAAQKAALDARKDNTAQIAQLEANAAKSINNINYAAAQANLEEYLRGERNALEERNARGLLLEKDYSRAVLINDSQAAAMRLELAKTYGQKTTDLQQQLVDKQLAIQKELTDQEKAKYQERALAAQDFGKQVGQLIADSLFEQGSTIQEFLGKVLILVLDVVEKQLIAQQTASIASASIQSMSQPDSVATFGASGIARIAILTAAITTFFEIFKAGVGRVTAPEKQFAKGTVLGGASHANGGVQLYSRSGYHFGEAEEDEVILTKGVWRNPLLRPIASLLNEAGGGAPLMRRPHMALGGVVSVQASLGAITTPVAREALRGAGPQFDPKAIGALVAQALRDNPAYVRWVDFESAQKRNEFTERLRSD